MQIERKENDGSWWRHSPSNDTLIANRINSGNFNDTTLKLAKNLDHPFLHLFIFCNMFAHVHGLDTVLMLIC